VTERSIKDLVDIAMSAEDFSFAQLQAKQLLRERLAALNDLVAQWDALSTAQRCFIKELP